MVENEKIAVTKYIEVIQLIDSIKEQIKVNLNLNEFDGHGIMLSALYGRITHHYSASCKLAQMGFCMESATIIRALVEVYFYFEDYYENPNETFENLEQLHNKNLKKLLAISKDMPGLKDKVNSFSFDNLESKKVFISTIAGKTGNTENYKVFYGLLCDLVHVNLGSIERTLNKKDERIVGVNGNVDFNQVEIFFIGMFRLMIVIFEKMNERFKLNIHEMINELESKCIEIEERISD